MLKSRKEGAIGLHLGEAGKSVWKLVTTTDSEEVDGEDLEYSPSSVPYLLFAWDRSLHLAREVGKYMPGWQRATLAIFNTQYGGGVTHAICFFLGTLRNSVFHGKGEREVFLPFPKSQLVYLVPNA